MGENEIQKTLFEAVKKDDKPEDASPSTSVSELSESPLSAAPPQAPAVPPVSPALSPSSPSLPLEPVRVPAPPSAPTLTPTFAPTPTHASTHAQRVLTHDEQKKLFIQMDDCKRTVAQLHNQLISLNDKKRAAFQKKDEVSQKIRALIGEVKSARSERDKLTTLVKESKTRRGGLNGELRTKIEEAKKLNHEKNELIQKHHLTADPSRLKKEIEALEYVIETEAPSPSEEKKLMKLIKDKKKLYEEAKSVSSIFEKIHGVSKEIDKLKHKCDETHKKIQNRAANSQEKHEAMIETVKGLDELRAKEKEAGEKYFGIKKEFDSVNEQLQGKLMELGQLQGQVGAIKHEQHHERKKTEQSRRTHEHATLTQKKREIEQKFKQKKKLTTEDIIAMQG